MHLNNENKSNAFHISRLTTNQGTFQITGQNNRVSFNIKRLLMMGTDGWVELDLDKQKVQQLILLISENITNHLGDVA
ncbi:hypothetical protein CW745_11480 [Psychromonas sp. psych-6C06]|uniref:hypothetical protein n=1 Tax=Psychromonas sp. psych-6C06 TaxID=2058089 RepID=UPI000C31CAB5|nr:hypothetical protein [Psychromonas sp. psych-6C06]PKF61246.1 hypothetical protein CW745_11480 [Psychromonas sp. psych-6C06]